MADGVVSGLIQTVTLTWDKSARGGDGARSRQAVPRAGAVPLDPRWGETGRIAVHRIEWSHRNAFREPVSNRTEFADASHEIGLPCLTVGLSPDGLAVRYRYDLNDGGAPDRWHQYGLAEGDRLAGTAFILRPGEWGRITSNGRFVDIYTGNWWYRQVTLNVACFHSLGDGRLFFNRAPVRDFRLTAELL